MKAAVTSPLDSIHTIINGAEVDKGLLPNKFRSIVGDRGRRLIGLGVEYEGFRLLDIYCHGVEVTERRQGVEEVLEVFRGFGHQYKVISIV